MTTFRQMQRALSRGTKLNSRQARLERLINKLAGESGVRVGAVVDSMARRFGSDADINIVLQDHTDQDHQPPSRPAGDQSGDAASQAAEEAAEEVNDFFQQAAHEVAAAAQKEAAAAGDQVDAEANRLRQELENAKKHLRELAAQSSKPQTAHLRDAMIADWQREQKRIKAELEALHRKKSIDGMGVGPPSRVARKSIGRGVAQLKSVSPPLRSQMAALINKIVMGGRVGGCLGDIPVTDNRRLVRRLQSKRPLKNAWKQDDTTGRPAILFLPDVSPSCGASAEAACRIANAAGYAGTSGADVLVMPHFNGDVDNGDEYIPWLNGQPMGLNNNGQIFREVLSGESRHKIRVVVIIGDHDGEHEYKKLEMQPRIKKIVWLHNLRQNARDRGRLKAHLDWPTPAVKKITLVTDCTDEQSMMSGFDLAVKNA